MNEALRRKTCQISRIVRFVESEKFVAKIPVWRMTDLQSLSRSGAEAAEGVGRVGRGSLDLLKS